MGGGRAHPSLCLRRNEISLVPTKRHAEKFKWGLNTPQEQRILFILGISSKIGARVFNSTLGMAVFLESLKGNHLLIEAYD
jgi:hypothetical protein